MGRHTFLINKNTIFCFLKLYVSLSQFGGKQFITPSPHTIC